MAFSLKVVSPSSARAMEGGRMGWWWWRRRRRRRRRGEGGKG